MLKRGQEITVYIEKRAFPDKGKGLFGTQKITVKNTLPGQTVRCSVKKAKSGKAEAILSEVIERAPCETVRGCPHFELCGGCAYQSVTYDFENELKKSQLLELLAEKNIDSSIFEGIEPSPKPMRYRNKCELSFGDSGEGSPLSLGMRRRRSYYEVVDMESCGIIPEDFLKVAGFTRDFYREKGTGFYHKGRRTGILRHLALRKSETRSELLINLVAAEEKGLFLDEYCAGLLRLPLENKIAGILFTENKAIGDVVQSDGTRLLYGRDWFYETLSGLDFKVTPFSFFQTSTAGAEKLYDIVKNFAGDVSEKNVMDLYCGAGTISQILALSAKSVTGIEIVEEAVASAESSAKGNGLKNCRFIAGDVGRVLSELKGSADLVVVDPPREGLTPKALKNTAALSSPVIIYVSCNPATLVRDVELLKSHGYMPKRLRSINTFCRTNHIESVCRLELEER